MELIIKNKQKVKFLDMLDKEKVKQVLFTHRCVNPIGVEHCKQAHHFYVENIDGEWSIDASNICGVVQENNTVIAQVYTR